MASAAQSPEPGPDPTRLAQAQLSRSTRQQITLGGTQPCTGATQPPAGPTQPAGSPPQPGTNQSPGTGATPNQQLVVVYVAGKVRRPGLVRAPIGSRVADVLALAGGALRGVDLTTLNLARQVTDGEQIIVGQPSQPQPTVPPASASSNPTTAPNAPVNLNTATLDELDALPGVGPVLAQRILDYRTQNGPFTTIDQLQEVPGVGPKKFDSLKSHVRI
jgi:competence protein ComEA